MYAKTREGPWQGHWRYLAVARAIENQLFMVCANRTGMDENLEFPGMSMVVDPWGEIIEPVGWHYYGEV